MDTSDILARPHRMNAERETPFVEGFATELASVGHSALTINGYLVLLCYKLCTFVSISLALRSVMQYVEIDEPPPDVFLAPA
jgi:hypothetical protein